MLQALKLQSHSSLQRAWLELLSSWSQFLVQHFQQKLEIVRRTAAANPPMICVTLRVHSGLERGLAVGKVGRTHVCKTGKLSHFIHQTPRRFFLFREL